MDSKGRMRGCIKERDVINKIVVGSLGFCLPLEKVQKIEILESQRIKLLQKIWQNLSVRSIG